jgi:hypothetical protein
MRFRQLISVSFWQYIGLLLNVVLQFLTTLWVKPEIFGVFAKLQTFSALLVSFGSFSLHHVLLITDEKQDEAKLVYHLFWLSLFQALLLLLLALVICVWYYFLQTQHKEQLGEYAFWFVAFTFSAALLNSKQVIHVLYDKQRKLNFNSKINIAVQLFVFVISLVWVFISPSLASIASKVLASNLLFFLLYWLLALKYLPYSLAWRGIDKVFVRSIIQIASRVYLSRLVETLQSKADVLLANYLFDNYQIGLYERIKYYASLPQSLLSNVSSRINNVIFADKDNLLYLHQSNFLLFFLNLFGFCGLFCGLFAINYYYHLPVLGNLFPFYLAFWHFAGLFALLDNVRYYLQVRNQILRTTLKIRLSTLFTFLVLVLFAYAALPKISLLLYAFLLATSHLAALCFMPPQLLKFQARRFTKLLWRRINHIKL